MENETIKNGGVNTISIKSNGLINDMRVLYRRLHNLDNLNGVENSGCDLGCRKRDIEYCGINEVTYFDAETSTFTSRELQLNLLCPLNVEIVSVDDNSPDQTANSIKPC